MNRPFIFALIIVILIVASIQIGRPSKINAAPASTTATPGKRIAPADLSIKIFLPLVLVNFSPHFGVNASRGNRPDTVTDLADLNATWVRVNVNFDSNDPDLTRFLSANINVVATISNRNASNAITTYGTPAQWPNAGFPYLSKTVYQNDIRNSLTPALPYLTSGHQLWVQAENEVGDASINPNSRYWRGTDDQYLMQLQALYEVVRSMNPSMQVVMTSITSDTLDVLIDPGNPKYNYQTARLSKFFSQGQYDATDLHFYGCASDIPAKAQWVVTRLPTGKRWISTENSGPDPLCPSTPIWWYQNQTLFEQTQAQQVSMRLSACANSGGVVCLWFSLFDLVDEVDEYNHLGLLDPRFTPARQRPAYNSFKTFAANYH